jgi:hypothetical protein
MDEHCGESDCPLYDQIIVLTSTVRIMRRMRGKKNPEDVPFGSAEWDIVSAEFTLDVYEAMNDDPGDLSPIDL